MWIGKSIYLQEVQVYSYVDRQIKRKMQSFSVGNGFTVLWIEKSIHTVKTASSAKVNG